MKTHIAAAIIIVGLLAGAFRQELEIWYCTTFGTCEVVQCSTVVECQELLDLAIIGADVDD